MELPIRAATAGAAGATGLRRFVKQADPQREALQNILLIAGLSGLAGGSIRGLVGLPYLFGTRPSGTAASTLSPSTVNIPYPVIVKKKKQEEELPPPAPAIKRAANPNDKWWYYPAMIGASLPAFYGSYKLIDTLMDRYRKSQLQGDEAQARKEYEAALIANYPAAQVPQVDRQALKTAAVAEGAAALEALADLAESGGAAPGLTKEAVSPVGLYLGLATLLGLTSGGLMYDYARERSNSKLTEEAIKKRERQRWAARPPEVFAVPTPVKLVHETPTAPAPVGEQP